MPNGRRLLGLVVGGTVAWPPWSSDLTPMDFSVWRYVKDKILVPSSFSKFGRTTDTDNISVCDHSCGHDSQDLGRNCLQLGHLLRDTRKAQ